MENLGVGLELMIVGMLTVFIILLIIIYLGKWLIALVNKFAPEDVIEKKELSPTVIPVDAKTITIIQSAVNALTGGKGKVMKVEKIK